jgi:ankyrin repeat protein
MAKEEKGMKSLLLAAAKDADLETVMKCIKAGSPLDEKDGAGHGTALHLAARSNCPDICEFLLRNGANVNAQTTWKSTPLHVASERGHTKCVLRLLVFGADINGVNCNGETALHLAAKRGLVDMVELLIGAGAKLNVPDKDGITPLRAAKAEGREDTVAILSRTKGTEITIA